MHMCWEWEWLIVDFYFCGCIRMTVSWHKNWLGCVSYTSLVGCGYFWVGLKSFGLRIGHDNFNCGWLFIFIIVTWWDGLHHSQKLSAKVQFASIYFCYFSVDKVWLSVCWEWVWLVVDFFILSKSELECASCFSLFLINQRRYRE